MTELSKNKQNELAFFIIYNVIVLNEMQEKIDLMELISAQAGVPYEEVDIYVKEVVLKCIKNYASNRKLIEDNLKNWKYERISTINKAILMYGITNGLYMDSMEKKLVIDVSVKLSKKYGEDTDYKFVNAILDKVI